MTDQQVLRYTQLCKRRMDILLHSGVSWLPEYEAELKSIDQELKLGSGQMLVPGGICRDVCGPAARTRAIQRPYACYADAFGRPGGMEEDLYNG